MPGYRNQVFGMTTNDYEIWDMLQSSGQLAVPLPATQQQAAQPRDSGSGAQRSAT